MNFAGPTKQFMRDIDNGFWRFCAAYNDATPVLPPSADPVVSCFLPLDLFTTVQVGTNRCAQVGHADVSERFNVAVNVLSMPWAARSLPISGQEGFFYVAMIAARGQRHLDYPHLLRATTPLHQHVGHVHLAHGSTSVSVTLPACLGADKVISVVNAFYDAARNALLPGNDAGPQAAQHLADTLPEYVVGPEDLLSFLNSHMPCTFFQGIGGP